MVNFKQQTLLIIASAYCKFIGILPIQNKRYYPHYVCHKLNFR